MLVLRACEADLVRAATISRLVDQFVRRCVLNFHARFIPVWAHVRREVEKGAPLDVARDSLAKAVPRCQCRARVGRDKERAPA